MDSFDHNYSVSDYTPEPLETSSGFCKIPSKESHQQKESDIIDFGSISDIRLRQKNQVDMSGKEDSEEDSYDLKITSSYHFPHPLHEWRIEVQKQLKLEDLANLYKKEDSMDVSVSDWITLNHSQVQDKKLASNHIKNIGQSKDWRTQVQRLPNSSGISNLKELLPSQTFEILFVSHLKKSNGQKLTSNKFKKSNFKFGSKIEENRRSNFWEDSWYTIEAPEDLNQVSLNIMVSGPKNVGKTSFVRMMMNYKPNLEDVFQNNELFMSEIKNNSKAEYSSKKSWVKYDIIDTPGYNPNWAKSLQNWYFVLKTDLKRRFDEWVYLDLYHSNKHQTGINQPLEKDNIIRNTDALKLNNNSSQDYFFINKQGIEHTQNNNLNCQTVDKRIHLLFYLVENRTITFEEGQYLKKLSKYTNIIPIIPRGDLYEQETLDSIKKDVIKSGKLYNIEWFQIPHYIQTHLQNTEHTQSKSRKKEKEKNDLLSDHNNVNKNVEDGKTTLIFYNTNQEQFFSEKRKWKIYSEGILVDVHNQKNVQKGFTKNRNDSPKLKCVSNNRYRVWQPPFVIINANDRVSENNKEVYGRKFNWGFCSVEDPKMSDFLLLYKLLVGYLCFPLKHQTAVLYQQYNKKHKTKFIKRLNFEHIAIGITWGLGLGLIGVAIVSFFNFLKTA